MAFSRLTNGLLLVVMPLALSGCGGSPAAPTAAEKFSRRIQQVQQDRDPVTRTQSLARIASEQWQARELSDSQQTARLALESAMQASGPADRAIAFSAVAPVLSKASDPIKALDLLKQATADCDQIREPQPHIDALLALAAAQQQMSNATAATEALTHAEKLLSELDKPEMKVRTWGSLALGYHAMGEKGNAPCERAIEQAQAGVQEIDSSRARCRVLVTLATEFQPLNRPEIVSELLRSALEAARATDDAYAKTYALVEVAQAHLTLGNVGQAREIAREAETTAKLVSASDMRRQATQKVDALLAQLPK